MCNQGVNCIDLYAVKWQILHCFNIRANGVPDSAPNTVILELGVLDSQKGEVTTIRNTIKKRSRSSASTKHVLLFSMLHALCFSLLGPTPIFVIGQKMASNLHKIQTKICPRNYRGS